MTRQYFALSGRTSGKLLEENATWVARWDADARLQSLAVEDFERVESRSGQPLFSDCTAAALGENRAYQEQLLYGFNYWLEQLQDSRYFEFLGTPGLALGDANGDQLDDLYRQGYLSSDQLARLKEELRLRERLKEDGGGDR